MVIISFYIIIISYLAEVYNIILVLDNIFYQYYITTFTNYLLIISNIAFTYRISKMNSVKFILEVIKFQRKCYKSIGLLIEAWIYIFSFITTTMYNT
jgi:hypothetical protein